jgi:hypothetical protein
MSSFDDEFQKWFNKVPQKAKPSSTLNDTAASGTAANDTPANGTAANDTSKITATQSLNDDLIIRAIKTSKSKVFRNPYMKSKIIPRHPCAVLFNGRSGSGKTNLLASMFEKKTMYKDYFTEIYLFSGAPDDIFKNSEISKELKKENIFDEPDNWSKDLAKIFEDQGKLIDNLGIDKSPRILIIFEDIQNHQSFMRRDKHFTRCFIAGRHSNVSVFLTSQSYTKTPRECRINATNILFFEGTMSEQKIITDEYCPSVLTKKEFGQLIHDATVDEYSFLFINMQASLKDRYRHNLDKTYAMPTRQV